MSNLTVKHAVDTDAVIIAAMGEYAMQESPHYRKFEYNPGKAMDSMIDKIEDDSCLVLTIEDNGQIVGFFIGHEYTLFYSDTKCATDDIFYIMPAWRGGKIAKDVLKVYDDWCRERETEYAHLGTTMGIDDNNVIGLYEGLGFEQIGTFLRMGMQ